MKTMTREKAAIKHTEDSKLVDLDKLRPSKLNPRKASAPAELKELADSITRHGILQPILVRKDSDGKGWEVLAGSRRVAAARMAGLKQIPACEVDWDDATAQEASLAENIQRENLTALEEARAMRAGMVRGESVKGLAARYGKSERSVFRRLKLLELDPKVQGALEDGKITLLAAQAIAGIQDPKEQVRLLSTARKGLQDGQEGNVLEHINRSLAHSLVKAPWPLESAEMAGKIACTACPERTRAQEALFEGSKEDHCLNPACWTAKTTAWSDLMVKALKDRGLKIRDPRPSERQAFRDYDSGCYVPDPFVNLKDKLRYGGKEDWGGALGMEHGLELVAFRRRDGEVILAVNKGEAAKLLRDKGVEEAEDLTSRTGSSPENLKKQRTAKKKNEAARRAIGTALTQLAVRVEAMPEKKVLLMLLGLSLQAAQNDGVARVCSIKGMKMKRDGYGFDGVIPLLSLGANLKPAGLRGLLAQVLAASFPWVNASPYGEEGRLSQSMKLACEAAGVKFKALLRAELKAGKKAKTKTKAKAPKAGAGKRRGK